jgi:hypothetical protein
MAMVLADACDRLVGVGAGAGHALEVSARLRKEVVAACVFAVFAPRSGELGEATKGRFDMASATTDEPLRDAAR